MQKALPYLALASAVIATAIGAMFIRWANAPGSVTVFYRTSIATLLLFPVFLRQARHENSLFALPVKGLLFALLGGLFIALDQAAWSAAVLTTKIANATYFNSMAPLWVALFALLILKEKLRGIFWAGLFLALTGAGIILGNDLIRHPHLGSGDILGLLSSFFYGGYFVAAQFGRKYLHTVSYTWIATLMCALTLLVLNSVSGAALTGYPLQTYLVFLGAALVSQVLGYYSMGYALGHLPASTVAPSMLGKPVIAALLAIPLFGEMVNANEIIGGFLILAGIYMVNRR
ncbi:MAG: DMT family transporter [Anaerolineae bacterium]|nr:DMT family transporter [Anaerolineae bacterium]